MDIGSYHPLRVFSMEKHENLLKCTNGAEGTSKNAGGAIRYGEEAVVLPGRDRPNAFREMATA